MIRRIRAVLCGAVLLGRLRKWGELYELMAGVSMPASYLVSRYLLEQLQSPHIDLPLICCFAYSAVLLVRVVAIGGMVEAVAI